MEERKPASLFSSERLIEDEATELKVLAESMMAKPAPREVALREFEKSKTVVVAPDGKGYDHMPETWERGSDRFGRVVMELTEVVPVSIKPS